MPLNLETASSGDGGEFYDKLRFNSVGGHFWLNTPEGEKRFANGFKAVFDMTTLTTGWARYNGTFLDFEPDPSLDKPAARPAVGDASDDGDVKWKRAFKMLAFSQDAFGGVVDFTHSANVVTAAFTELYAEYEKQAADGMVPVVEVSGTPHKVGDYYRPVWSIVKMVPRPAALPDADAPVAAAAPAAAPDDDEEF